MDPEDKWMIWAYFTSKPKRHIRQIEIPAYISTGKEVSHLSFIILFTLSINKSMSQFKIAFNSRIKPVLIYLSKVLVLAIIYHLAARLGLRMADFQANTSPVWPPTGIGLAALFILGYRYWPGITLGVLLGSILTGAPVNLAIGMALGNTLEALTAVYCLKKLVGLHSDNLDSIAFDVRVTDSPPRAVQRSSMGKLFPT